jgi:hypothetical protein
MPKRPMSLCPKCKKLVDRPGLCETCKPFQSTPLHEGRPGKTKRMLCMELKRRLLLDCRRMREGQQSESLHQSFFERW